MQASRVQASAFEQALACDPTTAIRELENADNRMRRVCGHLEKVRERRAELLAFEAELSSASELERAIEMTARYLPD